MTEARENNYISARKKVWTELEAAGEDWLDPALDIVKRMDNTGRSMNPNEDGGRNEKIRGFFDYFKGTGLEGDELFDAVFGLMNTTLTSHNRSALLADFTMVAAEQDLVEQAFALIADDAFVVTYHQEAAFLTIAAQYSVRGGDENCERALKLVDHAEVMYGKTPRYEQYRKTIRDRAS